MQGCHGYLLSVLNVNRLFPTQGTNAQAHLLLMSLIEKKYGTFHGKKIKSLVLPRSALIIMLQRLITHFLSVFFEGG